MSQNNRNSNSIYLLGAIAGIISAIVTVLTYLEIKPYSTPSVETTTQPTPESTNQPTQDPTPTKPPVIPTPRVDWEKATLVKTLTGHSSWVSSVAFSPDGKTLASDSLDKTIKLWSLERNREIATLTGHSDLVWSVAFSPDCKTLASGSRDDTIKIWQAGLSK